MPRFDPVIVVLAFIPVAALLFWGLIVLAGPGVPSDAAVLGVVAGCVALVVGLGWFLAVRARD